MDKKVSYFRDIMSVVFLTMISLTIYYFGMLDGISYAERNMKPTVITKPELIIVEKTKLVENKILADTNVDKKIERQQINLNFDILTKSGYSRDDLRLALSSNSHKGMIPYIDTFIKAEEQYGVNALYLMCQLGLESGWGKYTTGKNNIAGWTNGKGGYRNFDSVESCIMYVASKLSTFYKDNVGTRLGDVCAMYCPNAGYANDVMRIMMERERVISHAN